MVYKLNSLKLLNVSFSSYILVDNNYFIHKLQSMDFKINTSFFGCL